MIQTGATDRHRFLKFTDKGKWKIMGNTGNTKKIKLTPVSVWHYVRLTYRSILFILLIIGYVRYRFIYHEPFIIGLEKMPVIIYVVWAVYVIEMLFRFFPSKLESPGCQKQFARNYIKTGETDIIIPDNNGTVLALFIWIVFNLIFGALHMKGILDDGIMILLCGAYSVCDLICILFFCPFQSWILKNKCCSACRIYNWDYAMMFTPLFFVEKTYTWSLLALSIALLIRWELTFYLHPERFSEHTNAYLKCTNCTEKLCTHKKQLHSLWKKTAAYTAERKKALEK